jgi:hypothetical protein
MCISTNQRLLRADKAAAGAEGSIIRICPDCILRTVSSKRIWRMYANNLYDGQED